VDLRIVGTAAQDHADDVLATARPGLRDEHLAVGALFDSLDLPHVDIDAGVLDVGDRAAHELWAQLGLIALLVAADGLELPVLGGHPQLEEKAPLVPLEPVAQALE